MPRKKAEQLSPAIDPAAQETAPKKWAEAELLHTPANVNFQLTDDRIDNALVFKFADDPGQPIKDKLIHFGYRYLPGQKAWTVNATPVTREIARRLSAEFSSGTELDR